MSGNNKYIRLKNMYNKCTNNLYLLKKNNYQGLPWNNTIEEDTFRYPDLFAGGKGINVWPIVKNSTPTPCSGTKITPPNINTQKKEFVHSLNY
jgi:hypothetical protein